MHAMGKSSGDLQQQQSIMHFKKKWLQQERALSAANPDPTHFRLAIPSTSPSSPRLPTPVASEAKGPACPPFQAHEKPSPLPLNIPRFARFGLGLPLQPQFSADSSFSSTVAPPADLPWLLDQAPQPFRLQLDSCRGSGSGGGCYEKGPSQERLLIDINKPPPSPTQSLDSEIAPSMPCAGLITEGMRASSSFPNTVMDYSVPASLSHSSWLPAAGCSKAGAGGMRSRHPGVAPTSLLHIPHLSPRGAELPPRSTDLSLHLSNSQGPPPSPPLAEEHQCTASPRSAQGKMSTPQLMRKPRSNLWHAADELALSGSTHQRYANRMILEAVRRQESSQEHEADAGDEDTSGSGDQEPHGRREGSEEDELQSKGGAPKACLHCGSTKTPLWRNGPPGPKSLCNACGIRFNKIRSGKRKPTAKEASMLMKYERSSSLNSSTSEVVNSGSLEPTAPKPAQPPVATVHKSRSKLGVHRQSSAASSCLAFADEEARRGKKREAHTEGGGGAEDEDDLEVSPVMAFQRKPKKQCQAPSSAAEALKPSNGQIWRPRDFSVEAMCARSRSGGDDGHEDASSSDHESCLSEPLNSLPESPMASMPVPGLAPSHTLFEEDASCALSGNHSRQLAQVHMGADSPDRENDDSDVEAGARLLMEIFHSAPAAVEC